MHAHKASAENMLYIIKGRERGGKRTEEGGEGERRERNGGTSAVLAMVVDLLTLVGVVGLAAAAASASFVCPRVFANF